MTSIPFLSGLPDSNQLQNIGQGITNVINPDAQRQLMLKQKMAEDPTFRQKLIDAEAENPGITAKLFGQSAIAFGLGSVSSGAQQEIFDRGNADKPIEQVAKIQTPQSENLLRTRTGANTPSYTREKNEADITSSEATAAPAKANAAIASANATKEAAEAAVDYHIGQLNAQDVAAKASDDAKNRDLTNKALQYYQGPKGVITALTSGDPNMSEDTRNALFSNEGIWRQYQESRNDARLALSTKMDEARMNRMDALNNRQYANQRQSLQDELMKHDSQTNADIAAKAGFKVNSLDLYNAQKLGLQPILDKAISLTPQQLQAAVTPDPQTGQPQDPILAQVVQSPTLLTSWKNYKDSQNHIDDKDLNVLRTGFQKEVERVNSDVLAKSSKSKGVTDPTVVQEQIDALQQHPYAKLMQAKGTPVNVSLGKTNGFLGMGKTPVLKIDTTPSASTSSSGLDIAQAVKLIKSGQADRAKTLADPRLSASDKAAIIKGLNGGDD